MFGSNILDIAIGTVFVFLLLSLVASSVNELILSFLNMRGRNLAHGLREMLEDPAGQGLVKAIYEHGLVYSLYRGQYSAKISEQGHLPSYIPARTFALAFLDHLRALPIPSRSSSPGPAPTTAVPAANAGLLTPLREAASQLQSTKVKQAVVTMIDEANHDLSKLQQSVENWYNSTMDRVSGWYKYRTQWILFWIGVALALTLNADTVLVVKHLSNDAALRQALVAEAQEQAHKGNTGNSGSVADQTNRIESLGLPIGWRTCANCPTDTEGRNLPGWDNSKISDVARIHFFGWLITAVAISLGAPFWFDLLNKFMVVRSTVKPREKSHEEKSKDAIPADRKQT